MMTVEDHARSNARGICSGGVGSSYALLIIRGLIVMWWRTLNTNASPTRLTAQGPALGLAAAVPRVFSTVT